MEEEKAIAYLIQDMREEQARRYDELEKSIAEIKHDTEWIAHARWAIKAMLGIAAAIGTLYAGIRVVINLFKNH